MREIVVVGAGIIGLAFSVAAARQGFMVEIFDRNPEPRGALSPSSNVLAINPSSKKFLQEEGVWSRLADHHRTPFKDMSVKDGTGSGCIFFSASEMGFTELGHIVDQIALRAALIQVAESFDNLKLNWGSQMNFQKSDVPMLVGADGIYSEIRDRFRLRTVGYDYQQMATVCIARTEKPHNACARQWFLGGGPLAMLPLNDAKNVAVVWSSFQSMEEIDDQVFGAELFQASEGDLGEIHSVGRRFEFKLRHQHALKYVAEGVALLGDAAHTIHPLAGQGANLGFGDARALITELSIARLEGRSLGDLNALKRFERDRQRQNRLTAVVMECLHRLFTSKVIWSALFRNEILRLFQRNNTLKKLAIGFASK